MEAHHSVMFLSMGLICRALLTNLLKSSYFSFKVYTGIMLLITPEVLFRSIQINSNLQNTMTIVLSLMSSKEDWLRNVVLSLMATRLLQYLLNIMSQYLSEIVKLDQKEDKRGKTQLCRKKKKKLEKRVLIYFLQDGELRSTHDYHHLLCTVPSCLPLLTAMILKLFRLMLSM